jgi:hypothetical protein
MYLVNPYIYSNRRLYLFTDDFEAYASGAYVQFMSGLHYAGPVYRLTTGYVTGKDTFTWDSFERYATGTGSFYDSLPQLRSGQHSGFYPTFAINNGNIYLSGFFTPR